MSALRLSLFGVTAAAVLAGIDALTHDRIQANAQRAIVRSLVEVTGDPRLSMLTGELAPPLAVCTSDARPLYDIRAVTTRGYGGVIELLVAVDASHRVAGVRAISHHETPRIGDVIDTRRSDWILGFSRHDGDAVDGVTGATITTRAVIAAVDALDGHADSARCTHVLPD